MRINCGSQNAADFSGVNWLADTHATGGDLYSVADAPITDASLEGLYRDFRFGDTFTYSIPVPSQGRYKVSLHLAELFHDVPGKRGFSVSHEGLSLFGEIDMLARGVRKYEPLVLQADVEVGGLELKLEFTKSQDKANCMALEVVKI